MKKKLTHFIVLLISFSTWSQINTFPETESFDSPFITGIDIEFIPNWTGNEVQADTRIFRDEVDFNSAPAAMSVIPTGGFSGDVRISLDLTDYENIGINFLAKSVVNGTGNRSAILTIDTSIDGGNSWIGEQVMGSFPNENQADFTAISYALPGAANNQQDVLLRIRVTRSGGDGTTAKLVIDDVEISENTGSNLQVLVHYWNFNDNSSEAAITTVSQSLVAGAALTHIPGGTSIIDFAGGTGQNFNALNLNARNGDAAGTHLRFNDPIGGGLRFDMPTTGYENVVVKFASRRSGQGAGTQLWSYSIDGTDFIPFQNVTTFNADPQLITLDFTSIAEVNDNPDFSLLVEFEEGAGGTGGNNRFDNFTLDATPLDVTPLLITNLNSLTFNQTLGAPSSEQAVVVSGINLEDDITIEVDSNFEISLISDSGYGISLNIPHTDGVVGDTNVYVRLNNSEAGLSTGTLTISSTNAADELVDLEGNTVEIVLSTPSPFALVDGDYTFTEWDENSPAGTYPANMVFWTHATTDPDLDTAFIENWNCLYNLTNRSRINGEGENGFSFVNTGNSQFIGVCDGSDPDQSSGDTIENGRSGAVVLALNTIDAENILVEWTARTIAQNNRVYALRMQYRIGDGNGDANADWQDFDIPVEYTSNESGHFQSFTTLLPQTLENEEIVHLRWVYYYVSGSGSRAQIALDDITVSQAGGGNPIIVANPDSFSFTQTVGAPSAEQILTVSANNLEDDLTINAPEDFEISLTSGVDFSDSLLLPHIDGVIENINVFVRFNRATAGSSSGNLLISSLNALTLAVDLEGVATLAITTNPVPFVLNNSDYSFTEWDENSPAGTYPANMIFWTHATTDPDLDTHFIEDWGCVYNLESRSRVQGLGAEGFSFVNTGNSQFIDICNGGDDASGSTLDNGRLGAAVLALNTENQTAVTVLWTARTIAENNRVYALRMQYRIGNGGGNPNIGWQDFETPVEYVNGATGDSEDFMTMLPEACDDQPLVQLRWVYYHVETGATGSRAQIALDDIMISGTPLSVDDFDFDSNRLVVYPNPVSNTLNLNITTNAFVYDISGKQVSEIINSNQVNIENLNSGVYFIKTDNGQVVRFIKK